MPITAKMNTMMASTKQRLPSAPSVRPIMLISKLSVGHDLASLNTLSCSHASMRRPRRFTLIELPMHFTTSFMIKQLGKGIIRLHPPIYSFLIKKSYREDRKRTVFKYQSVVSNCITAAGEKASCLLCHCECLPMQISEKCCFGKKLCYVTI